MITFQSVLRLALACFLILSCTIKPPEIKMTGEKQALEKQILGTYEEIQEEVWMVASVRSSSPGEKVQMTDEKRKVLEAIQNRSFNKDDIDEFKTKGLVGENNQGYLEILEKSKSAIAADQKLKKLVEDVIKEDNQDRDVIMSRLISVNESLKAEDMGEVRRIFSKMNRDSAKAGEWIQLENGKWTQK